jgi:hypothetical protein
MLFIDEAESMFPSRYHSAEGGGGGGVGGVNAAVGNKLLASLLKWMEGISGDAPCTVILASNRAEQLDPALLSRCAGTVALELPTARQRCAILARYAKQLSEEERSALSRGMEGMAGRDILRVCEVAERRHVAAGIRGGSGGGAAAAPTAPALGDYEAALRDREDSLLGSSGGGGGGGARGRGRAGRGARAPAFSQWWSRRKGAAASEAEAAGGADAGAESRGVEGDDVAKI